jgi:thiamine biosynthesis protein ThiI
MARVAERLAKDRGAEGLFSGDSLGQVASQTLSNIAAVDLVLDLPMFRPLISYDKQEIIDLGHRLGLHQIALEPYKDCCSIIASSPATVANMEWVAAVEEQIDLQGLVESALADRTTLELD